MSLCKQLKCPTIKNHWVTLHAVSLAFRLFSLHSWVHSNIQLTFFLPFVDKRSMIVDAGKMHVLDELLTKLKKEGHRVLIYSTMTKVIDLLEVNIINASLICIILRSVQLLAPLLCVHGEM